MIKLEEISRFSGLNNILSMPKLREILPGYDYSVNSDWGNELIVRLSNRSQ